MKNNNQEELEKVIRYAKYNVKYLKHKYLGTEHFIASVLKNCPKYKILFRKCGDYKNFISKIKEIVGEGKEEVTKIEWTPLMGNLYYDYDDVDDIMNKLFLEEKTGTGYELVKGFYSNENEFDEVLKELKRLNQVFIGNVPRYLVNLNEKEYITNPAIGRDCIIEDMEKILLKMNKPNVLLVGDAGTGKTAIVEGFVYRIKNKLNNPKFHNYTIFSVSSSSLVCGTKYRGEFEEKIEQLCSFLKNNKNVILFIDEMHTTINAGGAEGAIDLSNILKPYLARGDIKVIGATTTKEVSVIRNDTAYSRRFTTITINQPTLTTVTNIIEGSIPKFEKFYDIKIDKKLATYIVRESQDLKGNFPDKAIDVLENVCSDTVWNNEKEFNKKDIDRIIEIMKDREKELITND